MKFVLKMSSFLIEKVGERGRLGTLQLTQERLWRTPMFFIHTLTGSVPHMTSEVFDMLYSPSGDLVVPPIQISIDSAFPFHDTVQGSGLNISRFVGLPNCASFLSIHNPLCELPMGFNDKHGISIWPRHGRRTINSSKLVQLVNDFEPDFFQSLTDFDVSRLSSQKRVKKSTARNLDFLKDALENTDGSRSIPFASIEFAWFLADRVEADKTLSLYLENQDKLGGFCINGLKDFNPSDSEDEKALTQILAKLPSNKPRFVAGDFNFLEILNLVSKGVDLFDSSAVTRLTEEGIAVVLPLQEFLPQNNSAPVLNESLPTKTGDGDQDQDQPEASAYLHLKDKRYFGDFEPILKNCDCYTCRKHTRSYVHHLLATKELLAPVLIMYHNLFQFSRFFDALQNIVSDEEKMSALRCKLEKLIPSHEKTGRGIGAEEASVAEERQANYLASI